MIRTILVAALPILAPAVLAPTARAAQMFGPGYDPCGAQTSTLDIVECTRAKTRQWDAKLNIAYAALLRIVEPGQQEPLRAAQRLWIQYRDANCGFYGAQSGTIRQIQAAECLRAMTEDRASELEQAAKP